MPYLVHGRYRLEVWVGGVAVDHAVPVVHRDVFLHRRVLPHHRPAMEGVPLNSEKLRGPGNSNSPPEPVEAGLFLLVPALLLPILLLEVGVEPVRPLADAANVEREVPRLLGRRRYREWMPFAEKLMQSFIRRKRYEFSLFNFSFSVLQSPSKSLVLF